jgi:hypothetical protein
VELELKILVPKHHEPLMKLRAEGIKERVARTPAKRWRVAVAQKQSRAEVVWEEEGKGEETLHCARAAG